MGIIQSAGHELRSLVASSRKLWSPLLIKSSASEISTLAVVPFNVPGSSGA
jgi:hypothetical protein